MSFIGQFALGDHVLGDGKSLVLALPVPGLLGHVVRPSPCAGPSGWSSRPFPWLAAPAGSFTVDVDLDAVGHVLDP